MTGGLIFCLQIFQLPRGLLQPFAELGIGHVDQRPGPLPDGLPVEVGDPVLGDNIVDVAARRDHPGARLEHGHDLAHWLTADGGGAGEGDDGLAALGTAGAVDKVDLPAHATVKPRADRIGAHLAGQINLDGRVDRDHAVILRDAEGIVDILRGVQLDHRVVMDEVIKPPGPHHETGHDLARVQRLLLPVDEPLILFFMVIVALCKGN